MVCRKVLLLTMVPTSSLPRSRCLVTQRSLGRNVAWRDKNGFVGGLSKRGRYASVNPIPISSFLSALAKRSHCLPLSQSNTSLLHLYFGLGTSVSLYLFLYSHIFKSFFHWRDRLMKIKSVLKTVLTALAANQNTPSQMLVRRLIRPKGDELEQSTVKPVLTGHLQIICLNYCQNDTEMTCDKRSQSP